MINLKILQLVLFPSAPKKKYIFALNFFMLSTISSFLFSQVQFPFKIGAAGSDQGYDIAKDAANNIYVTGVFQGTVDFDPGAGTANLTGAGLSDIFVAKYNSSGIYQWAFGIGSAGGSDNGRSIATDAADNVYITGIFFNTADFKGMSAGPNNLISAGVQDVYVAKYTSAGVYQWAFRIGSTGDDEGYGITTDAANNVYVTGTFIGTVDFKGMSAGPNNLTAGSATNDIFVAKYNSAGVYQWAFNIGNGTGFGTGLGIATDAANNVYVTGGFAGINVDFDPGGGVYLLSSSDPSGDIFVAKYDAAEVCQWAFKTGSAGGPDIGRAIRIDAGGGVLVTGNRFSASANSLIVAKYNSAGVSQWSFIIASGYDCYGYDISSDVANNVYVTGSFMDIPDFDPGAGSASLTSAGNNDVFIAKYDASGNYICAFKIGAASDDRGYGIVSDGGNNVYVTGTFRSTADFDPGAGTFNMTASGYDIYVSAYTISGCPAYPLPVELLSFNAECTVPPGEEVKLQWQTASETNNDYFTVERSLSYGEGWGEVGTVQGAGTPITIGASTIRKYEFTDVSPLSFGEGMGERFYRLKQTDFDGKYEYFGPISVNCSAKQQIMVFPSISNSGYFTVVGKEIAEEITVYNLLGEKVYSTKNELLPFIIDLTAQSTGVYIIRVKAAGKAMNQKLIISR